MARKWWLIPPVLLAAWIAEDLAIPRHSSLSRFDGHEVGRLETAMWRSYYEHHSVKLFGELVELLRDQYHLPFWRACLGACHAARAAVVFQRGRNRNDYELALPDVVSYYALIRRSSDISFPVEETARLELEWWIVHRERAHHPPGDLERSLAELQAAVYQRPPGVFAEHANARATAMLLRDSEAEAGGVSERDWSRIEALLVQSWTSVQTAVAQ
jgi:hypothetical protein